MKVRKFYPRQVLRKLQGNHAKLDTAQAVLANSPYRIVLNPSV